MTSCKVGYAMEQNLDHLTSVAQKVKKATPQGGVAFFGILLRCRLRQRGP